MIADGRDLNGLSVGYVFPSLLSEVMFGEGFGLASGLSLPLFATRIRWNTL